MSHPMEPGPDPFAHDVDRLMAIASEPIVRRGVAYFKENRVMEIDWDAEHVWALVEGSVPDQPYSVDLGRDPDGELLVECDCPFDWEPVCKHAVAALLAYGAASSTSPVVTASAAEAAVAERAERARAEVRVKHVGGKPWFGTWHARSVTAAAHRGHTYTVEIRSLENRVNYCTCPDHAINQLGTCKHIEAVLHRLRKRKDYRQIVNRPMPMPFVYLAWESGSAPRIRLERCPRLRGALKSLLDSTFDAGGNFSERLPEDFFRFAEEARDLQVLIGEDARQHALRLTADQAHRERRDGIRDEVLRWGNQLPGVHARLYPYQVEGVAFLAATGRALLADDMGLGKTLQAIAATTWLSRNAEVVHTLVVCPASLKHQWAREIGKFSDLDVQIIQGGPKVREAQYRRGAAFTIVNYELVLRDQSVIVEGLAPDLVILDEAQRIKNWRTKTAAAVKQIPSRFAFVLSGTPLENRIEDLYSLMQVVEPRVLGPLWRCLVDFHVTDERGKVLGYRNLSELRRRIAPVMLRRNRALVADQLPARIEQRLDVPMTPVQRELHDSALSAAAQLAHRAKRRPLTPSEEKRLLASLMQARMACDAAGLVDGKTTGSPKLDELAVLLTELCVQDDRKAVIFSQWERMTAMVEQLVRRLGLGFVRLHGGVPSAKRGELLDRFRDDEAVRVFISTDAGGVGLNLQRASVLVNLDMPWNPAVLEQRIARVHRLGQVNKVQIVLLTAADSYEERVMALIESKRELFDNVVDSNARADTVGLAKRTLEVLMEDLEPTGPDETAGEAQASGTMELAATGETPGTGDTGKTVPSAGPGAGEQVQHVLDALGSRVQMILRMADGLLAVVERVDPETSLIAESLSSEAPVALIDRVTLAGLQRIDTQAFDGASVVFDSTASTDCAAPSPWIEAAREKLRSAEILVEQRASAGVIDLLSNALIAAATARAGQMQPPPPESTALWVYAHALPRGWLTPEEGTAVVRAAALRDAPEVPPSLVREVLEDARQLVARLAPP